MPAIPCVLRFHYYEVMDRDHTLIRLELIEGGHVIHVFTNLPEQWEHGVEKAVYGNQSEDFVFPTREAALGMIHSNPAYRTMTASLARFLVPSDV